MNDAELERRAAPIRAAFEAARFDERTPEEAGFAKVFEDEIKPRLLERLDTDLEIGLAEARRRKLNAPAVWLLLPLVVPLMLLPIFLALSADGERNQWGIALPILAAFGAPAGLVVAIVLILISIWKFRPVGEDPNQYFVLTKLLAHLGCRMQEGPDAASPSTPPSPIQPNTELLSYHPNAITGTFHGHMPFDAWRTWADMVVDQKTYTIFRGWYIRTDLPFSFKGTTILSERGATFLAGPEARGLDLREVRLESSDFTRAFAVASTDQEEARVIFTPDVMQHLLEHAGSFRGDGRLMLGFAKNAAHAWLPSERTALSDWKPFDPAKMIQDLHEEFAELSGVYHFLHDIDVIADYQGFQAEAARNRGAEPAP